MKSVTGTHGTKVQAESDSDIKVRRLMGTQSWVYDLVDKNGNESRGGELYANAASAWHAARKPQSIRYNDWGEAVLFPDELFEREKFVDRIEDLWYAHDRGEDSVQEYHERLANLVDVWMGKSA